MPDFDLRSFVELPEDKNAQEKADGCCESTQGPVPIHMPLWKEPECQVCLSASSAPSSLLILVFAQPVLPLELRGLAPSQAARA